MAFHKSVAVQSAQLLKQSRQKALRSRINDVGLVEPWDAKKAEVLCEKTAAGALLFRTANAADPLFFCLSEEENEAVLPTVYSLWSGLVDREKMKETVRTVVVSSATSEFILNGADVMVPGILRRFSDLQKSQRGQIAVVFVLGNPAPIAVGKMLMSWQEMQMSVFKGKGVQILHHVGDCLWKFGSKTVPNEGFLSKIVLPLDAEKIELEDPTNAVEEESGEQEFHAQEREDSIEEVGEAYSGDLKASFLDFLSNKVSDQDLPIPTKELFIKFSESFDKSVDLDSELEEFKGMERFFKILAKQNVLELKKVKGEPCVLSIHRNHREISGLSQSRDEDENVEDEAGQLSATEMEEILDSVFLQVAKFKIIDSELPMNASSLLSSLLKLYCPFLQLKQTKYKKFSKYLQKLAKDGLISVKSLKADMLITSINRSHALFKDIHSFSLKARKTKNPTKNENENTMDTSIPSAPLILRRYKPSKQFSDVFSFCIEHSPEVFSFDSSDELSEAIELRCIELGLYSTKQCRAALMEFIVQKGLDLGSSVDISKASCLKNFLGTPDEHEISKGALFKKFMDENQLYHSIILEPLDLSNVFDIKFKQGDLPKVSIVVSMKQGRKLVTTISGVEIYGLDPNSLAPIFQKLFSCSCTTKLIPQFKHLGKSIQIQGDFARQAAAHLADPYGIPPASITIKK